MIQCRLPDRGQGAARTRGKDLDRFAATLRQLSVLTSLLATLAAPALRAEQPKLAVLEFEVQKGLTLDRRTFSSRLQNAARKAAPGYLVMTQGNIETLVRAAGKSLAECEGQCAVDTGKLVGADIVVAGRISKIGTTFAISMQMYDTATGALLAGEDPEAQSENELLKVSAEAAEKLLAPLSRRGQRSGAGGGADARGGAGQQGREGRIEEQAGTLEAGGAEEVLVAFETEPAGAVVQLDGRLLCQSTPCKKLLALGPHEVSLQKEGYEALTEALQANKGLVVSQRLSRISSRLDVETDPAGLGVSIDGERVGQGPVRQRELVAGTHEVLIDDPCWLRAGERVVLQKGEDRTLRLSGKQRVARLTVNAEDEQGNAVEARAKGDGQDLGAVPGTFTVSSCLKTVSVEGGGLAAEQALALVEGKVSTVRLELAARGPRTAREPKSTVEFVELAGGKVSVGLFAGQSVAPFWLARTATTKEQYARCVAAGACSAPQEGPDCTWDSWFRDDYPINCVSLDQAGDFCRWIGGRLPEEAERDWAVTSGMDLRYPWGDEDPGARACWSGGGNGSQRGTCRVGSHPKGKSKQGIHDLVGNVKEWVHRGNHGSGYSGSSWHDNGESGSERLCRGGDRDMRGRLGTWTTCIGVRCAK